MHPGGPRRRGCLTNEASLKAASGRRCDARRCRPAGPSALETYYAWAERACNARRDSCRTSQRTVNLSVTQVGVRTKLRLSRPFAVRETTTRDPDGLFAVPCANKRPRALLLASAGQSAKRRGPRGYMARRWSNRANDGEQLARDRTITAAEWRRNSLICGGWQPFSHSGHHPSRNMPQGGCWAVFGVWVWPGFLRRLVRATMRRRVRGCRPLPPVARGKERAAKARRSRGGRSERASHHGTMREISPFEVSSQRRTPNMGRHATRVCFFPPKACQYAPSWE